MGQDSCIKECVAVGQEEDVKRLGKSAVCTCRTTDKCLIFCKAGELDANAGRSAISAFRPDTVCSNLLKKRSDEDRIKAEVSVKSACGLDKDRVFDYVLFVRQFSIPPKKRS